eukprot:587673-Rhodomonas_salina.1
MVTDHRSSQRRTAPVLDQSKKHGVSTWMRKELLHGIGGRERQPRERKAPAQHHDLETAHRHLHGPRRDLSVVAELERVQFEPRQRQDGMLDRAPGDVGAVADRECPELSAQAARP